MSESDDGETFDLMDCLKERWISEMPEKSISFHGQKTIHFAKLKATKWIAIRERKGEMAFVLWIIYSNINWILGGKLEIISE